MKDNLHSKHVNSALANSRRMLMDHGASNVILNGLAKQIFVSTAPAQQEALKQSPLGDLIYAWLTLMNLPGWWWPGVVCGVEHIRSERDESDCGVNTVLQCDTWTKPMILDTWQPCSKQLPLFITMRKLFNYWAKPGWWKTIIRKDFQDFYSL